LAIYHFPTHACLQRNIDGYNMFRSCLGI